MVHNFFAINFFGKSFILTNVTEDEIRTALRQSFPKWTDEIIEQHIATKERYIKPKHFINDIDEVRAKIAKRGTPINALIRLVKSYDAYYRNTYRQWGIVGQNVKDTLSWEFCKFENAYNYYKRANDTQLGDAICEIIEALKNLAHGTNKKCRKFRFDRMECLDGRNRRLGILELAERVPIVLEGLDF